ncbi:MAG TPA: sigma-54 dependent transcriptional regulator [Gemmataceae bacterium]|nr:sigma-54 dependent transcriptional regulator [Gemmataceae bacterium]
MSQHILIIDDEEAVCWSLRRALERGGFRVSVASSAEEGLELAGRDKPDAVILDVRLPGMDGLSALGQLRELTHDAPIIVITAHGNLATAVRAVEGGAFDYLAKPFDLAQALDAVARALSRRALGATSPESPRAEPPAAGEIIGHGQAMQRVFKQIALVAPRDASVMITGESGTGKELVARAIHRHSTRRDRPFIPIHVAALNPNLVESELFGHVKGAYTGATQGRDGLLALANGGTAFLDEVADIPLSVQAKLLRLLEFNEVFPVGSSEPQRLNLRILSATHRELAKEVAEGRFRHDLFFRLNGFQIHLPALRERGDDILELAVHFLKSLEPTALPLPAQSAEYLKARSWPGNVRELRHALEHASIIARGGPLLPEHFPSPAVAGEPAKPEEQLATVISLWVQQRIDANDGTEPANLYEEFLNVVEPALLGEVLERLQGNRLAASRWLGLARATVRKLIAKYYPEQATTQEGED